MQQIVDLQNDAGFQGLDVALLSIAFDSPQELAAGVTEYGTTVPLLSDPQGLVCETYDVLKWAAVTGEPGHTFILVDADGKIAWIRDYGAAENGGLMYVEPGELVQQMQASLSD